MTKKYIQELIEKYKANSISEEEMELLLSLIQRVNEDDVSNLTESEYLEVKAEMAMALGITPISKKLRLWPRIAVAASIVAVFLAGGYFYYSNNKANDQQLTQIDIDPGKVAATLTLSNGKKIYVADIKSGKVAEETGVKITKNENGELVYTIIDEQSEPGKMQTLTTYRGETQALVLPDGSKVWLNAASSIKYPSSFVSAANRKVEITGEAYFEIAKDKTHPFIVATNKQEVEVLGTHFNINSYPEEQVTRTTLLEGSVKVSSKLGKDEKILEPGMQASLKDDKLIITEVDPDDAIAWKEGYFIFTNEPLSNIMKQVARWYDVEIDYRDQDIKNKKFSGSVSRFAKVSQVLKKLEFTKSVTFKIEGKKIIAERKTN